MVMEQEILDNALEYANAYLGKNILKGFLIQYDDLVFEERVKMNCFYCGKYGRNWKCPPNLPRINYEKMFEEFENCAAIFVKLEYNKDSYEEVRNNSSLILHKGLLQIEKYLWNHNNSTYLSFIAGSCKLCKNGCGENRCNNPYISRSPVEATGVNIVETVKKYGLEIEFPPKEYLIRCGLLLW